MVGFDAHTQYLLTGYTRCHMLTDSQVSYNLS